MTRPAAIAEADHLCLRMHDIAEAQEGMTPPGEVHVRSLLDFARSWDRAAPLVIHCYAGISRSTASAYIIAAALAPKRDEAELAATLRRAFALGDAQHQADFDRRPAARPRRAHGRRRSQSIGRGADAFEGVPFALEIDALSR